MNTCPTCQRPSNPIPFTLGALARDEKLPFVERVLSLAIESRHGSHRRAIPLPRYSVPRAHINDVDLDLVTHAFIPGMMGDATKKARLTARDTTCDSLLKRKNGEGTICSKTNNHGSPSTLGRGSPVAISDALSDL